MKRLILAALALVCAAPCVAQVATGTPARATAGYLPGQASFCSGDGGASWTPCSSTVDTVVKAPATDRGAIVGTTAVQLMAANTARRGFSVQVQSATASCYISGQGTATADYHSLLIAAGSYFETPNTHTGTGAVSVICSAASTPVYSREW